MSLKTDKVEWISTPIGRNAIQNVRKDFSDVVKTFNKFVTVSQFYATNELTFDQVLDLVPMYRARVQDTPNRLQIGDVLYGVTEDHKLVKLRMLYDTSD